MERGLFLDLDQQDKLEQIRLSISGKDVDEFQEEFSLRVKALVKEALETLADSIKENLYFLGSFGLNQPSLFSDLDLCYVGHLNQTDKMILEDLLREAFRKYSLLVVKDFGDFKFISNFKTLISLRSIEPVFKDDLRLNEKVNKEAVEPKLGKIKLLVKEESVKRRSRFGSESGRLLFSFKTASGGMLDLKTLDLHGRRKQKKEKFIYKIRVLNQILYKKDQFYVTHAKKLYTPMGFESEADFFDELFTNLRLVKEEIDEVLFGESDWLEEGFSSLKLRVSVQEKEAFYKQVNFLWGRVNSPNYHVYTVGEHLKACFFKMIELIKSEGAEHSLSNDEKDILLWAALFHDLGKDQVKVPHAKQGALYALSFGRTLEWPAYKTGAVSWLVREHLTLARQAFKMDAFNPELMERLSLKGVSGRRAVQLYFLTVSDTKATNPKSWTEFKRDILNAVLKQALGFESQFKTELKEEVLKERVFLVEGLGLKEISLIPHGILALDLKGELNEGFKVYEKKEGGFWLRYYSKDDHVGLAYLVLSFLNSIGVYVDLALFSSKFDEGVVYNWFKVESSLSLKAFQKRLSSAAVLSSVQASKGASKARLFDAIQIRYKTKDYAVLSFLGKNQQGLLLAAVEVLAGASMSILWGHAVAWGDDVEDVFGVSYDDSSDWSFVEV